MFNIFLTLFSSPPQDGSLSPDDRIDALLQKVNLLETRLNSESQQKENLAEEVETLRERNIRLQEESATASQQLKRFTEWFFQTIDKT
jgi:signal-induced proliferation-associated 1 like protein 1